MIKRQQFISEIIYLLEEEYGKNLPTRSYTATEELVSCILSQNSNDKITFPTFDKLRKEYPTWDNLLSAGYEKIYSIVKPVGLAPQKTANIIKCLQIIKTQTGDYELDFLKNMEPLHARRWLENLPGVGPKTATIVLTFGLGFDLIPVDTHIHRVSKRLHLIPQTMDANKAHDYLLEIIPDRYRFPLHQLLIVHGRNTCTARNPKCKECPIKELCPSTTV